MPKCCAILYALISAGCPDRSAVIAAGWTRAETRARYLTKTLRPVSPAGLNGR